MRMQMPVLAAPSSLVGTRRDCATLAVRRPPWRVCWWAADGRDGEHVRQLLGKGSPWVGAGVAGEDVHGLAARPDGHVRGSRAACGARDACVGGKGRELPGKARLGRRRL